MSSPIRRRRRVLPNRPGDVGSREWAEAIVSATIGAPRYLLGLDGALYWSPVPDEHEDDGGPCGAATYATPMAAAVAATMNAGMVRLPDGWEISDDVEAPAAAPDGCPDHGVYEDGCPNCDSMDGGGAPGDGGSGCENPDRAEPASDPAGAVA